MTTTLSTPVTVLAGLGTHRDLQSVFDLLDFLNEWPIGRRGPIYVTAYKACSAALAGQGSADQARQAFVAFARVGNALPGRIHPPVAEKPLPNWPAMPSLGLGLDGKT
jgi:hypothetical protein